MRLGYGTRPDELVAEAEEEVSATGAVECALLYLVPHGGQSRFYFFAKLAKLVNLILFADLLPVCGNVLHESVHTVFSRRFSSDIFTYMM